MAMGLDKEQIASLLNLIASSRPDDLDCDGCFEMLAEFAETELATREVPDALRAVQTHLEQCACCQAEYDLLRKALREIEGQ